MMKRENGYRRCSRESSFPLFTTLLCADIKMLSCLVLQPLKVASSRAGMRNTLASAALVILVSQLVVFIQLYNQDERDRALLDHSAVSSIALEKGRLKKAGVQAVNVTTQWRQTVLFKKGAGQGLAPLVVLLHGFPDNPWTFQHQLDAIAGAGFDVIAPVLRGYEPSTAGLSLSAYDMHEVAADVLAIIEQGEAERQGLKVHLIGHDWGAVLAYFLAANLPGLFQSITTLAVPHDALRGTREMPSQLLKSWYMIFFQLPVLPERWLRGRHDSWSGLRLLWRQWSPGWSPEPAAFDSVIQTLGQPGVLRSAVAYYRFNARKMLFQLAFGRSTEKSRGEEGPLDPMSATIAVPTLALTGAQDGCIDTRLYDITMSTKGGAHPLFPKGLSVRRVQGAGHFLHQEKPEEVNQIILEWLKKWT